MKTVGQILETARKNKGLSLSEVEQATKIRRVTIVALEEGDWGKLPSPTFVKGLIKNYGHFLGLSQSELMAFYRREVDERKTPTSPKPILKKKETFRLTPRLVTVLFVFLATIAVGSYLFYQYRSFTGAPLLEVDEPKDNSQVFNQNVSVVGRTWPDAILKINGQEVQLSPGGSFSVAVSLPVGINTVTISAENRFGKVSTQKRTLIVEESSTGTSNNTHVEKQLRLEVKIGPNASSIVVEADGKSSFSGVLVAGSDKVFNAQKHLRLITHNAGSTKIIFNGQELVLGKEGQTVEKSFP